MIEKENTQKNSNVKKPRKFWKRLGYGAATTIVVGGLGYEMVREVKQNNIEDANKEKESRESITEETTVNESLLEEGEYLNPDGQIVLKDYKVEYGNDLTGISEQICIDNNINSNLAPRILSSIYDFNDINNNMVYIDSSISIPVIGKGDFENRYFKGIDPTIIENPIVEYSDSPTVYFAKAEEYIDQIAIDTVTNYEELSTDLQRDIINTIFQQNYGKFDDDGYMIKGDFIFIPEIINMSVLLDNSAKVEKTDW